MGRGLSWINAASRSLGAAIRLGYFRSEQKRLGRQEQLVTKFPFCSWEEGSLLHSAEPPPDIRQDL